MNKNINVKYLMLVLTFVDMIIMAVFLLVLSSNSTKKSVSINNSINESLTIDEETVELSTEEVITAEEIISEPQIITKEDYMNDKNTLFFASTFWTKLQNIFGHCCMSKLDKVAKRWPVMIRPAI